MGEVWLIVAVLIGADGLPHDYHPAVEFDLDSCRRTAQAINDRWMAEHRIGAAMCRLADGDRVETGAPQARMSARSTTTP